MTWSQAIVQFEQLEVSPDGLGNLPGPRPSSLPGTGPYFWIARLMEDDWLDDLLDEMSRVSTSPIEHLSRCSKPKPPPPESTPPPGAMIRKKPRATIELPLRTQQYDDRAEQVVGAVSSIPGSLPSQSPSPTASENSTQAPGRSMSILDDVSDSPPTVRWPGRITYYVTQFSFIKTRAFDRNSIPSTL